jgi:biopolymer transport protein ExbD
MASPSPIPVEFKKKARIEIIPLIDVIFFLLATFVLFTLSLNRIKSIPVQLPVASNDAASKPDDDMVNLQVSDQGNYYWNKDLITEAEIAPRLQQYKTQISNPRVLISGDNRAKFGSAVMALDEVRKAGIEQVSVDTREGQTGH